MFPLISEYIEAIKSAEDNFEELSYLRPILGDDGLPIMNAGGFSVVFKMKDERDGKLYAVKCFLKDQEGRAEAYRMIAEELEYVNSTFLTPIKYLDKELFVDSKNSDETEFPVLLMDWVEGQTLDKYIREHIDDQYELSLLAYQFSRLAMWLMPQPFAHGDLKPDNIIVKEDGTLVLVDYDGMYVPAMKGQKARELGSPDFRHPGRTEDDFDEHIDDFSLASILLSLKAISLIPELWGQYGASDHLLFSEKDYRNLSESKVIDALKPLMQDAELASLYSLYILALSQHNLSQVSFRLFNLNRPQVPIPEDINGYWQYIKRTGIWTDKYGVKYSTDKKFLINAPNEIREYTVPKGTKYIATNAFINCRELRSISLPNTLEVIGNIAFLFCVKLSSITIPKSVKEVGLGAFEGCFSLTTIVVDNNNMFYDSRKNCNAIIETQSNTLITGCSATVIPNSITKIGKSAFNHCNTLKVIIIPENILEIDDYAFSECYSLEKIIIPESVKKIGNKAFDRCQSLYSVEMTNGVEVIGSWTFAGCRSLTSIAMPNSINKIGKDLFLYCEKLTTIYIPYGEMGKFKSLLPKYKDKLTEIDNKSEVTNEDLASSWVDNYGARYSKDWKRLLKGPCIKVVESMIINNKNFSKADMWVSQPTINKSGKTIYWCSFGSFENGALLFLSNQIWKNLSVVNSDTLWEVFSKGNYIIREAHDKETNKWIMVDSNQPIMMISPMREMVHYSWELGTSEHYFKELLETSDYSVKHGTEIICNKAFENCVSLKTLSIPSSVEYIGASSFANCISLERIFVPYRHEKKYAKLLPNFEHMIKSDDSAS